MNEKNKIHAYLLRAEMFESMGELDNAAAEYSSALKEIKLADNQVLRIEVLLAQIKCTKDYSKVIDDLKQCEENLNATDNDTTSISLKVIVYDTIANCCLKLGKFSNVITYAEKRSMVLKMRSLSHYHLSLIHI